MSNYFTSFFTPNFKPYLKDLVKSVKKFGIKRTIIFSIRDLKKNYFYNKHYTTFQQKTGFGYWLWKPFFVKTALDKINFGDILFYVDAASLIIDNPKPLIDIAQTNESGIVAFDAWPLRNSQWTKRDAFINLNCDEDTYWSAKHVIATLFLIRKTDFTVNFINEWLAACENLQSLSDHPNISGKDNLPDFVSHRMDQSLLSILIRKYNIETYRNPSKWGNFLKMENFRIPGEHISSPYGLLPHINEYSSKPYINSPYATIMEFNRRVYQMKKLSLKQKIKQYFSNAC